MHQVPVNVPYFVVGNAEALSDRFIVAQRCEPMLAFPANGLWP
jgi:hypothetical protein